ncbi:ABC transporter substrate-binding protein [Yinghuangia soli]|uniref:ABC transporter substrate-binding protein n=1 Tax=Yinghuangia soli TaxID=2908204 RepID=A0AA41PZE5_9ACTN|nr:ABC transporter substrate-binding protein [Yinghuangia soli]MCF2528476.1 ABC transporter substrate-binding protein [Yinghuangia soli]
MRLLRTAALTAAVAMTAAACSGSSDNGDSGAGAGKYQMSSDTPAGKGPVADATWALFAEPQSLDYLYAYDFPPNTVLANVCEQLLRITPDFSIQPGLAAKFENPDPLTWVYTLREGVKFHDGTTMTADDAVASLQRHLDPANASAWVGAFKDVASVTKTGPMQLTVKLTKPNVLFNQQLAASPGTVESAAYLAKAGKDYGNPTGKVNCTGPYTLDSWSTGDSINLKKFDGYWDKNLTPAVDKLKLVFIQDPSARVNALLSGEVDGGYMLPATSYDKLAASGSGKLYFGGNSGTYNAHVANLGGALGDVRVRRALSLAVDRKGVVDAALNGYGVPAKAPAPAEAWGIAPTTGKAAHDALPPMTRDIDAAKKLVQEAGAAGKKIVVATISVSPEISIGANALRQAGKDIGLDVELKAIAPDAYTALFTDPSARAGIDLLITSGYNMTPDPLEYYGTLQSGQFPNYGDWKNEEYDKLVEQANAAQDPITRAALTVKLQEIAVRELPAIPLFDTPYTVFLGKRISGATPVLSVMLSYPWAAQLGSAS